MRNRIAAAVLFVVAFAFYLKDAAPSVTAGDSGEFITAAATLSIPHAPSFPTYTLSARAFMELVPWGAAAYRTNLFSAFSSALALMLIFLLCRRSGVALIPALALTLLAGVSTSLWMNSLVTEVFALNTSLAAALFLLLPGTEHDHRRLLLFAFLFGLGFANHQILLFAVPAVLPFLAGRINRRLVLASIIAGAAGVSVYGFLMVRAAKNPPLNWGKPSTPHGIYRTILRKDYGTLSLATGDVPQRNLANSMEQLRRFAIQFSRELPPGGILLLLIALLAGVIYREKLSIAMLLVFLGAGPFFFWLGNLPFDAQSEGVFGRFFILPVLALIVGTVPLLRRFPKAGTVLVLMLALISFSNGRLDAQAHRQGTLVLDYGRAMLRTLPANGAMLMDGGDDAFYSLLMLRYVEDRRPDAAFHDRGGLVFSNPYGPDFRSLPKPEKEARRQQVERSWLRERPLIYSTLHTNVLPGIPQTQIGFLYGVAPVHEPRLSWPLICLRSLASTERMDYRTRALAAFFPFMRGKAWMEQGNLPEALRAWRRAAVIGTRVPWLAGSLRDEYGQTGYRFLTAGRFPEAEKIYRAWIDHDPDAAQAYSNLGVVLERQNRRDEAREWYTRAMKRFPEAADPVFNLAVLDWQTQSWDAVISHLEEVLRRNPQHPDAGRYLEQARLRRGRAP